MDPALSTIAVVAGFVLLAVVGAPVYARRVRMDRAPIGVINLRDIVVISIIVVVLPALYLHIPSFLVVAVLTVVATGIAYFTLAPVLGRPAGAVLAAGLVTVDIVLSRLGSGEPQHSAFLVANDVLMTLVAVGVGALYVQSGIRARDVAVFALVLLAYDALATVAFPVMIEFFTRVSQLPVTPALTWGTGTGAAALGLGDMLMVVLWTLVADKAFGARAGLLAAVTGSVAVFALLLAFWMDWLNTAVPAMVLLGPLIAIEYAVLLHRHGRERTAGAYLSLPAAPGPPRRPDSDLLAAVDWLPTNANPDRRPVGRYIAVVDGRPVASGHTAGSAVRAGRDATPGRVPVLVWSERTPSSERAVRLSGG